MTKLIKWPASSVARKQMVACTGVLILGFVFAHLAGNLLIFVGPDAFNNYAAQLASLRPFLYFFELVLIVIALVHIVFTLSLVWENRLARGAPYSINQAVAPSLIGARWMPITGPIILIFVLFHIYDFTFNALQIPNMVEGHGDLGLYGVVYNSFRDPLHTGIYIMAMLALALHLTHAIQSALQTFGLNNNRCFPYLKKISLALGIVIALVYSLIPVCVLLNITQP